MALQAGQRRDHLAPLNLVEAVARSLSSDTKVRKNLAQPVKVVDVEEFFQKLN